MVSAFDADDNAPLWMSLLKTVFAFAMLIATPFLAWKLGGNLVTALRSNSWPQSQATITQTHVETDHRGKVVNFDPQVKYTFDVDGKSHTGDHIGFRGYGSPVRSQADAVIERFAVGTQHPVYYDPSSPSNCVLERGTHWLTWAGVLVPVITLVAGGFMSYEHVQLLRRKFSGKKVASTN